MVQDRMDRGFQMNVPSRLDPPEETCGLERHPEAACRDFPGGRGFLPLCLVLTGLLALAACNDSSCRQPVESRNCPVSEKPTGADLILRYSDPARYDSVIIEVYSGNVDDGQLEWTLRPAGHTTSKKLENIEFGAYSARASYYRNGIRGDAIDGDDVGTDSDSDGCGCVSYSEEDGELDLELE